MNCVNCGKNPFVTVTELEVQKAKEIKFFNEGTKEIAKAKVYNDVFYQIVEGKHKGNLVHIFDIIK